MILGRRDKTIIHKARDLGLVLPDSWKAMLPRRAAYSGTRQPGLVLSYPYISRPRQEHALLMAVNELVPKSIPSQTRGDICQDILLAIHEGIVSIEQLQGSKDVVQKFIREFGRKNFDANTVQMRANADDDREYYDIASNISRSDWQWGQMNDARLAHDAISKTFSHPEQLETVYRNEIFHTHRKLVEGGEDVSLDDTYALVESGTVIPQPRAPKAKYATTAAAVKILATLKESGVDATILKAPTGTIYLSAHYMRIRISDHPHQWISTALQAKQTKPPEYEWRTDIGRGFYFLKETFDTMQSLADEFALDCHEKGYRRIAA
jgi:hypothetical protein